MSGGPTGAENGTLTVMMGGEEITVNRAKPLIQCFSSKIVHFGAIGNFSISHTSSSSFFFSCSFAVLIYCSRTVFVC